MTDGQIRMWGRLDVALTGDVNDWAPTGIGTSTLIYVDPDGNHDITGINAEAFSGGGNAANRVLRIVNDNASNTVSLIGLSGSSSAGNQFAWSGTITIGRGESLEIYYDGTSGFWRALGRVSSGSTSPGGSDTYVQYNDGGGFGGDAGMVYDDTNDQLVVTNARVSSILNLSGDIAITVSTTPQNNWAPTGHATASVFRVNPDTADVSITGITAPASPFNDGRMLAIYNVDTGGRVLNIINNSGSSSAANQFQVGANFAIANAQGALFIYDLTATCWRCLGMMGPVAHTHVSSVTGGTLDAAAIASGTMATPRLGSGTADARAVLRGDQTYGPQAQLCIPFNATGAADLTDTDQPSAAQFLRGDTRFVVAVDLTPYRQVRLVANKQATAGATNSKLKVMYATATPFTFGSYSEITSTGQCEVATNVTDQVLDTGWLTLASGAQIGTAYIACTTVGGDGAADPAFGLIFAYFRA
jgi:hypothetical protein